MTSIPVEIAAAYLKAGLSVLPAVKARKRPAVGAWKTWSQRLPNDIEVEAWFSNGRDAARGRAGRTAQAAPRRVQAAQRRGREGHGLRHGSEPRRERSRATFAAWRGLAEIDHIVLAETGTREEFDDLEFLVNRGLCELNGVKNVVTLARRLA